MSQVTVTAVYATPDQQFQVTLSLSEKATLADAMTAMRALPECECTKEEYEEAIKKAPSRIDWSLLKDFEKEDTTSSSQTFACSGDSCEVVDIGA